MAYDDSPETEFLDGNVRADANSTASDVPKLPTAWTPPSGEVLANRFDLGQVWSMLRTSRGFVSSCALFAVLLVMSVTLVSRMTFKATGSLYLGELQDKRASGGQPDQLDITGGENGDVGTEIEILKSPALLKRAVLESGLNATITPKGWSAPRYLRWRLSRRDLTLLDGASSQLVATSVALSKGTSTEEFSIAFQNGGIYTVSRGAIPVGRGTLGTPFTSGDLSMTLSRASAGAPVAGDEYEMKVDPIEDALEIIGRHLTIEPPKAVGQSDQIKIAMVSFSDESPRRASIFVSELMQAYLDRRQTWKSEEATAAETFVTGRVATMKDSLEAAEQALADYKKDSPVVVLGDEASELIAQLGRYEEQRVAAQMQVSTFTQVENALKNHRATPEQYLVGETPDPVLASLSNNLAEAQQELTRMESRFTENAPALKEQRAQVSGQLRSVRNYLEGRRQRAEEQLGSLNSTIERFEEKIKTVPHAEQQLAQLTRNVEVYSKMYSFLLERQQQAGVTKASTISKNHILDMPVVAYHEESPTLLLRFLFSLIGGLAFGITFLCVRRLSARSFQTEQDIRRAIGDLAIFGTVPKRLHIEGETHRSVSDLFAGGAQSPFSEAFRHIRTNVYYSGSHRAGNAILITSPFEGDGKTLCTLSLAAALAADGKKVLVVEGDMHNPTHHVLLGDSNSSHGLSDLLTRQAHWNDVVRLVRTTGGSFHAIPAGAIPPSPAELLSSRQFGALMSYAKKRYEFVLIDSPPFPAVVDSLIMSLHADRVLSVLRLQNTPQHVAEEHIRRLSASTPHFGVIINDVERPRSKLGYKYYRPGVESHRDRGPESAPLSSGASRVG